MRPWPSGGIAVVALLTACVSYDPTGPHAEAIAGTYAATLAMTLMNSEEARYDTATATLALRDSVYRGRFYGYYRFVDSDSGRVAGTLRDVTYIVTLSDFGPPPKQIASIGYLRQLYDWCDLDLLGTGGVTGQVRGDTLLLEGRATMPCVYEIGGSAEQRHTELAITLIGIRVIAAARLP